MSVQPGPPRPSDAPARLGKYDVERRLGRGGMATVYLGRDTDGRTVALKVMLPQLAYEPSFLERFLREVEATRTLRHRNVVQVLEAGEQDGLPYMACEYVEGGSLEVMLSEAPKLAAALSLEVTAQLLEGLAHAHVQGIVHRDLKPANLLLTTAGTLKIADFGVAKVAGASSLTRTGALFGTPAYMSPEQTQGRPVDGRSDLFSAGVILYELLTGVNPHKTDDPQAALLRVQLGAPPIAEVEPTVTPAIEGFVEWLLEQDPDHRPQTAEEGLARLMPLVSEGRQKHPALLAEGLLDPVGTCRRLRAEQAEAFRLKARAMVGESSFFPASLWLHRAVLLDPENQAAQKLLAQVCQREKLSFEPSPNPKVAELEARMSAAPDDAKALLQLAQLHRLEGNLPRAVACLKRVLRLRPGDAYVAQQLTQMTGERFIARANSGGFASHIDTGGHAAASRARPVADATRETPDSVPTALHARPGLPPPAPYTPIGFSLGSGPRAGAPSPRTGPHSAQVIVPVSALAPVETATALQLFWRAWGRKLALFGAVVFVLVWAVRRVGMMIQRATQESIQATDSLHRGIAGQGVPAPQEDRAALEARLAAGARAATQHLELAHAAFRRGDYRSAIASCDVVIERWPKRAEAAEARFLRARALLSAGKEREAIEALARFAAEHRGSPHYPEALLRSGEALLHLGDAAGALHPLDDLLRSFPDSPYALEGQLRRGQARAARGDPASAEADFRAVLARVGPADGLHARAREGLRRLGITHLEPEAAMPAKGAGPQK